MTVREPAATPLTRPLALTVALAIVEDDHVTRSVMSQVLASLLVPVATICCVVFTGTVGLTGVTAIETGVAHTFALVTVICVEAEKLPECAVTIVTPVAPPVTTPAALTDAVVVSAEFQVPPRPFGALHRATLGPPASATFHNFPLAKNPS